MKDDRITIEDGIGVLELRQLHELTNGLGMALNHDEYMQIVNVYSKTLARISEMAEEQGIKI